MNQLGLAIIPVASAKQLEDDAIRRQQEDSQKPVIQGLAAHVRRRWETLRDFKDEEITGRLKECHRARNMEYSPEKLAEIRAQGGSQIFMGIVSNKCRVATAWLRDSLLGTGADKPWSIAPTPVPEVPPEVQSTLQQIMQQNLEMYYAQGNEPLDPMTLKGMADQMKDTAKREMMREAERRVERMERKMEDQLIEGGFLKALHAFTDDVATYPFAVLKGPAPRRRKKLTYGQGGEMEVVDELLDEYERVDPFKFFWAPWGDNINDIPVIELHSLTREDLQSMIGVEGYSEDAIRTVLADFGGGNSWLDDSFDDIDEVTGTDHDEGSSDIVGAIQLWDSVLGKDLIEWGLDEAEVEDPHLSYAVEVWMVKNVVIKAVLNYDPLARKPYFVTSYERVPGRIDGNGVADLAMDAQAMCNAAARALANNMGISSGPQVGVNISRLPAGENITQMYPWKIWQFKQSDYNDGSPPLSFFQPNSNAQELMAVFERFLSMADEVTGLPRYMSGEHVPGAGRTSSGLSMLISHAGKALKQVINNIDKDVIEPLLERKYQRNLRYSDDPDLIGDVKIIARGAMSLVVKEAEAVRRQEFLNMVLNSPVAQQVVGLPGAAELLRDAASHLNFANLDRVVPTREDVEKMVAQQQAMMMEQQAMMAQQGGAEPKQLQADGSEQGGRESNYVSPRPTGQ
jgi:hypothetical protein